MRADGSLWPRLSVVFCFLTVAVVLVNMQSSFRSALVASFVLLFPGFSAVRLIGLEDRTEEIVLGIALSVSAATTIALVMVYTHVWSVTLGVLLLVALTLAANYLEVSRR
jgi:uncharacterized membrane protein